MIYLGSMQLAKFHKSAVPRGWGCMHYCVGVEADRKSGKFSKTGKRKFNESGNSTIQQKWKFSKTGKRKFNKSGNSTETGKLEIQQVRIYHKNSKTGILWSCIVRNSDVQESRNSGKQQCVLLALSPQTFHKSGMAASVHSFRRVSSVQRLWV